MNFIEYITHEQNYYLSAYYLRIPYTIVLLDSMIFYVANE